MPQNNKTVVKMRLTEGAADHTNSCVHLLQEQILKDKRDANPIRFFFQSFPVSVLVVRLEPFSDPPLEILKKEVRGHKRECLIETCRLDEAFCH